MSSSEPLRMFPDVPVIGELPARRVASKLRQMGDPDTADRIVPKGGPAAERAISWPFGAVQPWQHTTHQYGYIPQVGAGAGAQLAIQHAGDLVADDTLKGQRINIHLDRLRIFDYPGSGEHHVMFTFKAQNQVPNALEPVSFSQVYRAQQGQLAGVAGYPVFVGLTVGSLGVAFQGFTVNVKNSSDEAILNFLDTSIFQSGLDLLTTAQPALKPFTEMTLGLAKGLAKRNRNVAVQDFYLGLDFTPAAMGLRLAEGNYIAVQVPSETAVDWQDWVYVRSRGAIVNKNDNEAGLPYNYVVFRVSRYEEG